jgi:hypothetical protein
MEVNVIRPTPKQIEAKKIVMQPHVMVALYGGAIRGGKSYWLILMKHSLCMQYPKSKWLLIRESLPTLKRTLIPTFMKLYDAGLKAYIKDFNRDTWTVTYHNGSQLIFMSESFDTDKDHNRFRGLEINGAGGDELNELQESTFYKIIERCGTNFIDPMPPIKFLGTCNPNHGWVKTSFYDRWEKDELPPSWAYIPAKITDNPHVPEQYLQSLKENMPADEYRMFVDGDWNVFKVENPFLYAFNPVKHLCKEAVYDPKKQLYMSIDFNLNPFGCIFFHLWSDKEGQHVHVFDEFTIMHGNIGEMVDRIKAKYGANTRTMIMTGDAMGNRGDISQRDNASLYMQLQRGLGLSSAQIKVPGNPTHENSRADCNFFLHNFNDFKVNPETCPNLTRDMRVVQCDAFGAIIKRNRKDLTQLADHFDCLRYLVNTFLKEWIMKTRIK